MAAATPYVPTDERLPAFFVDAVVGEPEALELEAVDEGEGVDVAIAVSETEAFKQPVDEPAAMVSSAE